MLTPTQLEYLIPRVAFAYPVRPWNQTKIDGFFLDAAYRAAYGRNHRGIDINGIGGGDTDLGLPVQSVFPGQVVDVRTARSWGWTVLVRAEPWVSEVVAHHLGVEVPVLEVQYTHLHQTTVSVLDRVNAGDHIGSIGKGDRNQYFAHLHLEVRRSSFDATHPQGSDDADAAWVRKHCLDPLEVMTKVPMTDFGACLPMRPQLAPINVLEQGDTVDDEPTVLHISRAPLKTVVRGVRAVDPERAEPKNLSEALLYGLRLFWAQR